MKHIYRVVFWFVALLIPIVAWMGGCAERLFL